MSEFDVMKAAGVVVTFVKLAGHTKTSTRGVVANLIDGNTATDYGPYRYSDSPDMTYRIQIRFPEVARLSTLALNSNSGATYGTPAGWTKCYVVYKDTTRVLIGSHQATYPGSQAVNFNVTGPWPKVVGIDFEGRRAYYRNTSEVWLTISEIVLMGFNWEDIGLRYYDGSDTRKILCRVAEAADKIRIRKGGITYGVPLIATTDSEAGNIRAYNGSAIYSFPTEVV